LVQAEEGIRDWSVTGVQTCALPIYARAIAMLVVVSLLAFLPGFFQIPPVDRDEARFAQATKQMIETGDYIDIKFQDETRYKKPEIGRATCRERGQVSEVAGAVEKEG